MCVSQKGKGFIRMKQWKTVRTEKQYGYMKIKLLYAKSQPPSAVPNDLLRCSPRGLHFYQGWMAGYTAGGLAGRWAALCRRTSPWNQI